MNVANVFSVAESSGLVEVANDLVVYGSITTDIINFNNVLNVNDTVILNGNDGSISTQNIIVPAFFSTGAIDPPSFNAGSALRGIVDSSTGSSITVYTTMCHSTSFVMAVSCTSTAVAVVNVIPVEGSFTINLSASPASNIKVNWFIVN